MAEFYPFFLIIFAGVIFSIIFRRMHVPWVVGLIIGGIIIGPHAFDILKITPTAEFLSQLGLVFLMFMAGLETRSSSFKGFHGGLLWLSFINGAIPFIVGIGLAFLFGYGWTSAVLIGIIFISSSIAVVIPSLENHGLLHTRLGQSVVMTSVIQDIASLILLSVVLQSTAPVTTLPLYIFYPLVVVILIILRFVLPKISNWLTRSFHNTTDLFQQEFRTVLLVLLGTVVSIELLGHHPIIAGFFAGVVLSDFVKNEKLKEKIRTISYGVFIPTFFLIIGAQIDITVLFGFSETIVLIIAIVLGSIISKFVSGWIGGKMVGFTKDQALLFGVSSVPQLSTTLAVAFAALTLGFIDQKLITAMVFLSILTVIAGPILMNVFGARIKRSIKKEIPK